MANLQSSKLNVFDLLERKGLFLPAHMQSIKKILGYNYAYTLMQMKIPEVLQQTKRTASLYRFPLFYILTVSWLAPSYDLK